MGLNISVRCNGPASGVEDRQRDRVEFGKRRCLLSQPNLFRTREPNSYSVLAWEMSVANASKFMINAIN
jgi:hypothetical protein